MWSGIYLHTNVLDRHTETSELKVNKVSVSAILSQFKRTEHKQYETVKMLQFLLYSKLYFLKI